MIRLQNSCTFRVFCAEKRPQLGEMLAVLAPDTLLRGTVSKQKGTKPCLKNLGSWQYPHLSFWQVAWKAIWNAAQLAQQPVLSWATQLVSTPPLAQPQVLLQHCFATTQAFAAPRTNTFRATSAHTNNLNRHRCMSLVAVFRLKDTAHV